VRTTIRIDEQLLREAKLLAARTGQSLTALIEDALRAALARQHAAGERPPVRLTTVSGQGLLPGVDLDDSAALLTLMESSDDPH
jgi:hypothetical protein